MSLLSVHPGAVLYLRPNQGFGTSPASSKRCAQIRILTIQMTSFAYEPGQPTDHLKLLHAYLGSFPSLQRIGFHWEGDRGLSPLSLATASTFNGAVREKPSPVFPRHPEKALRQVQFKSLQKMEHVNATMDVSQVAYFTQEHRRSLREFNFENVVLRSGTGTMRSRH
jgi:hypothetical protein